MAESRSIHEANDLELFDFLIKEHLPEIKGEYDQALQVTTQQVASRPAGVTDEAFYGQLAGAWGPLSQRVENTKLVLDELLKRIDKCRAKGIMPNDPREGTILVPTIEQSQEGSPAGP